MRAFPDGNGWAAAQTRLGLRPKRLLKVVRRRDCMKNPYPHPPIDAPADTDWFGGPIAWFSVSLSIRGENVDPDKISETLGVQADTMRRKRNLKDNGVADNGSGDSAGLWLINMRRNQTDEWDIEEVIFSLLDRITVKNDVWIEAVGGAVVRVFVGLSLDSENQGFGFSPELLQRVAALGARFDFDVYKGTSPN